MYYAECKRLGIHVSKWGSWIGNGHAVCSHFELEGGKKVIIVSIKFLPRPDITPIEVAGLLVHEAVHVWQAICESMGENKPSSEFQAYSIQWISQQLMYEFVRQTYES